MRALSKYLVKFVPITALIVVGGAMTNPSNAQDLNQMSRDIGQIERGFWTREFHNDLDVSKSDLTISHTNFTRVEWLQDGVPGRYVTDTLNWTLPLVQISEIHLSSAPGSMILQGSDQDSYCPLTVATFHCADGAENCDDGAAFYVCRYNAPELENLLSALKQQAPQIKIVGAKR